MGFRAVAGNGRSGEKASGVGSGDGAAGGGSGAVKGAFDRDVSVGAAQVGKGHEEAVREESEQVVARGSVGGHDVREFGLERGEEKRLDLDQIVAIVGGAAFVGVSAGAELGLVDADAIGIRFGRGLRLRSGEEGIWVVQWDESDGLLLVDERLELLGGQG